MTQRDAETIARAAIVMLHVVTPALGDNALHAALKYLPVRSDDEVSLRAARKLLEALPAWTKD